MGEKKLGSVTELKTVLIETTAFSEFWLIYPRKVSRFMAQKAFDKLIMADKLLAVQSLPAHIANWQELGTQTQYIPHASTWLHQRRFEDELVSQIPAVVICFWRGCKNVGKTARGTGYYCDVHIAAFKRGETP